ncbi:ATP-binding protein [Streptomyces lasalocidi]|uniref:ATP-binding protein n=1 Tax=Streptomyces lasalocidi TaxID=324833 RepID=A0A4U5WRS2_STRLS|nr:ATP-binding protein [Streptomyces lasalocidi]TKT03426.1 ATP-binding protein [Streptomyces lasalocidi]
MKHTTRWVLSITEEEPPDEVAEVKCWGWSQQPGCVPLSRKILLKWLASHDASNYGEDAALCFDELLANAIRIPSPTGLTETKWLLYEDRLRVEVNDWSPSAPFISRPKADSESGRGLILVHLLADAWGYVHTTFLHPEGEGFMPGKTVWFELYK